MTSNTSATEERDVKDPDIAPITRNWNLTILDTFSYKLILQNIWNGPISTKSNPDAPEEKYLEILSIFKFSMVFILMIGITAYYLMCVTAINPWSITP